MSAPQHTPGPWRLSETHQGEIVTADGRRLIAQALAPYPCSRAEQAANARLLAAAPDLLRLAQIVAHPHALGAIDLARQLLARVIEDERPIDAAATDAYLRTITDGGEEGER